MSIYQNITVIKIGDFFFKYRNKAFPVIIAILFLLCRPVDLFRSPDLEVAKDAIAILISLSGLLLRALVVGYAYIKRGGVNKQVYAETLVTEGMFSICRNPLYVGNMLIYMGIFLLHGAPAVVVLGTALFYFIYICIIATEEKYLRNKFGTQYQAYADVTSRWFVDFNRFTAATKGMYFNYRKVIIKDYPTIFTTLLIILVLEEYKIYTETGVWHLPLIIASLFCLVMMGFIRYLKKKRIITFE